MARFIFFQRSVFEQIGLMALVAALKREGHESGVLVTVFEKDVVEAALEKKADAFCFSITSGDLEWAEGLARRLKQRMQIPILVGGPGATYFPEIVEKDAFDAVCVGEGEEALLEWAKALGQKTSCHSIRNLWIKEGAVIHRNPVRPLISNMDDWPAPDRSIYDRYPLIGQSPLRTFVFGRGCPYSCTYCYNDNYKKLYAGAGKLVRFPSPGHARMQIEEAVKRYRFQTAVISDDTFTANKEWLFAFLKDFRSQAGVPFICNAHPNTVTKEVCEALSAAGCIRVCMGVESGSARLRREILDKRTSTEQIMEAGRLLHQHGITFLTYNMVGFPTETVGEAWETVALNAQMGTDYPWCSILQAYPRTRIAQICRDLKLLPENKDSFQNTFFHSSDLLQENIPELVRIQKLFWFSVRFPRLNPLWRFLSRQPITPFLHILFLFSFTWRYMMTNRLPLGYMARFAWHNLFMYRGSSK
ncbi:MAG: radical SAM protein [Verrucomicrobiae bacterium]|nr:radical SAM protein [Verrucomicrobiae bacterium]